VGNGGGGRLGTMWSKENGRERERALGTAVGSVDRGVGMAPGGTVRGGSARSWPRWASKQGRAAGRRRCDVERLTGGAGWQWGPVVTKNSWNFRIW
jgi:hypothetical protein